MGAPNNSGAVMPNSPAQSATCGSKDCGTPNIRHRSSSHCPREMSNNSVRAALLASVVCTFPPVSRHSRKQSMVPKASLPASRRGARAFDTLEQPSDLAGGKIRIEQQAGLGGDLRLVAARTQRIAKIGGAPVLPDDGIVDRLAGSALPDDRGFALIGDADAGDVLGRQAGLRHRRAHGRDRRCPDLLRVVLDPTGRRINLAQLLLRARKRLQVARRTRLRASRSCPGRWR